MLYFRYLAMAFRSRTANRGSFFALCAVQMFVPLFVLFGILSLFARFGTLPGWSMAETLVCYGTAHVAFAAAECFARGFDAFAGQVRTGSFDRILLRPRGTVVQVLGSQFEFTRIGRFLQGLAVLAFGCAGTDIRWTPEKLAVLALMCVSGVAIFTGIYMIAAAFCFWSVESIELANIFTDGGREMMQYPLSIYPKAFACFFTFVIPFGCVNWLPLMHLLGRPGFESPWLAATPLAGFVFLLPCTWIWRIGVRHYRSTGS